MIWVLFLVKFGDSSVMPLDKQRININRYHSEYLSILHLTCDLNAWYLTLSFSIAKTNIIYYRHVISRQRNLIGTIAIFVINKKGYQDQLKIPTERTWTGHKLKKSRAFKVKKGNIQWKLAMDISGPRLEQYSWSSLPKDMATSESSKKKIIHRVNRTGTTKNLCCVPQNGANSTSNTYTKWLIISQKKHCDY